MTTLISRDDPVIGWRPRLADPALRAGDSALPVGVTLGMLAAYYRRIDAPVMRLIDMLLAFPGIITALTIISILGRGVENLIVAIAIAKPLADFVIMAMLWFAKDGFRMVRDQAEGDERGQRCGHHHVARAHQKGRPQLQDLCA